MEAPRRRSGVRKPLADLTNNLAHSQSSSSLLRNKPRNPILSSAISKLLPNSAAKSTPQIAAKSTPQITAKSTPQIAAAISKLLPNSDAKSTPQIAAKSTPQIAVKSTPQITAKSTPQIAAGVAATPSRPLYQSGKEHIDEVEPCSVYSRRPSAKKTNCKSDLTAVALSKTLSSEKRKSKGKEIAGALSCPPSTKFRKIGERANEDVGNNLPIACTAMPKKKQSHKPSTEDSEIALAREYIEQQRAYFAEIDAFELPVEEFEVIDDEFD